MTEPTVPDGDPQPLTDDEIDAGAATVPAPSSDDPDPAAPWGRKADGTPKAKPGRRKTGESPAAPPMRPAGTKGRRTSAPSAPGRPGRSTDAAAATYSKVVADTLAVPAALLLGWGMQANSPALAADGAVLIEGTPALADAVGRLAVDVPQVAAILDRLAQASPYAALVTAAGMIVAQIAVNHGAIPPGLIPGTVGPEALIQRVAEKQFADEVL